MSSSLLIPTFFCPKTWASMAGDDKTRFCSYCQKEVHNLSDLNLDERLILLKSPAARLCARYKIAIRRPVRKHRDSYERHLLKYGVGVAAMGSVLLVAWELGERYYAANDRGNRPMPSHFFDEREAPFLGVMMPSKECGQSSDDRQEIPLDRQEVDALYLMPRPLETPSSH